VPAALRHFQKPAGNAAAAAAAEFQLQRLTELTNNIRHSIQYSIQYEQYTNEIIRY
jgi:hypothetical protein